jgi:ubiquinone/menaquinone biosynthesis C-methylase UbiE
MKVANPNSRKKLSIPSSASVLDVGSGHNPHPRANVITDKFTDSNYHRAADIKVLKHQRFVEASGEQLPFKDKEFDYVICCHVVEHVDNPATFLDELSRVGKGGYLECPSLMGEFFIPKESHQWVCLDIDSKLVFVNKKRLGFNQTSDFGEVFLDYLPTSSLGFKIMQRTHPQLLTVNYEWKDKIEYIVDPPDEELQKYFKQPWSKQMYQRVVPPRSLAREYMAAMSAMLDIVRSVFRSKVLKKN